MSPGLTLPVVAGRSFVVERKSDFFGRIDSVDGLSFPRSHHYQWSLNHGSMVRHRGEVGQGRVPARHSCHRAPAEVSLKLLANSDGVKVKLWVTHIC